MTEDSILESEITCIRCGCRDKKKVRLPAGQQSASITWICPECGVRKEIQIQKMPEHKLMNPKKPEAVTTKIQVNPDGRKEALDSEGKPAKKSEHFGAVGVRSADQ